MIVKKVFLFALLISAFPLFCGDERNVPFDKNYIPEIHVTVSKEQWNNMLDMYDKNSRYEEYVKADLTFIQNKNRKLYKNVGFRVRGNGFSRARPEHQSKDKKGNTLFRQAHFRVSFDTYDKQQNLYGHDSLNLKMFNGDPALVREIFAMDLFEKYGIKTAARSWYVKLYITVPGKGKNIYYGIYRMNESIDKGFLRERFVDNDTGYLWKCLHPADLRYDKMSSDPKSIGIENIDIMHPEKTISPPYDLKTQKKGFDNAKSKLLEFTEKLNKLEGDEFKRWIETHFAVDEFLKIMAVHVAVGSWDDYWNTANNYYLYFDGTGVVHYIPYDYDNILGTAFRDLDEVSIFKWGEAAEKTGGERKPLTEKIFSIPEYRAKYALYLKDLFDTDKELMDPEKAIVRINNWHLKIRDFLQNDTRQNDVIIDIPADWAKAEYYRLLSGDASGDENINFFKQRKVTVLRQVNEVLK